MSAELNFVRQQGFEKATDETCAYQYPALMWQPRVVGILVLSGLVAQSSYYFIALSVILWSSVALPQLNPFDEIYYRIFARPKGLNRPSPAPTPRRFAQAMAASFMLAIGLSLFFGSSTLAVIFEIFVITALTALIFGRFCLGSYIYLLLSGKKELANTTLPWS